MDQSAAPKKHKFFKSILIIIGLVILYFLVQWSIHIFQKPGHMALLESQSMDMAVQPPAGAMPVETERIDIGLFASAVSYTGSAVAYIDVQVFPRVEGWIRTMPVYPGDKVHKGQVLAQLDTPELSSRVQEARFGQLAETKAFQASIRSQSQAHSEAERMRDAIQSSKANFTYWQNEIKRSKALSQEDVITTEEYQREQSQYEAAQSQYNQALAQLRSTEQAAGAAALQSQSQRARSQQAAATERTQQIIRSYSTIVAQKNGVITERIVSPGTLVNATMPILRMAQINPIRIQANVAEIDLKGIQVGNPVRIWLKKDDAEVSIKAKVSAVFPASNLQTRTSIVEAILPNESMQILPGDYAVMDILSSQPAQALTVSNQALAMVGQQATIWVVEDKKAHRRYITTGGTNGNRTKVVNGLKAGEMVVTRGQRDLQENDEVVLASYGPNGLKSLPKVMNDNQLSQENQFRLKQRLSDLMLMVEISPKPPKVGRNEMTLDLASAQGNMNMSGMGGIPENLSLEITTVMPAMPSMANPKPDIQKLGKGKFKATLMLEMPGLVQIHLLVKDGEKTVSQTSFQVKVSE